MFRPLIQFEAKVGMFSSLEFAQDTPKKINIKVSSSITEYKFIYFLLYVTGADGCSCRLIIAVRYH